MWEGETLWKNQTWNHDEIRTFDFDTRIGICRLPCVAKSGVYAVYVYYKALYLK